MNAPRYVVGVDVGGTFTDVFALDQTTGEATIAKTPSTLDDQSRGFAAGIESLVPDLSQVATVVHGTTTGTNALLERKGASTGILTTEGFRDVLEMRRRDRPTTWGLWGTYEPVVPRNARLEVRERVLADGTVLEPVDPDEVKAAARRLLDQGCKAVCVFFVNGYANDANERAAAAAVREIWPNGHVTAATEILPEIREFERLSTATLNAYLQPVVSSYLDRLGGALKARGFSGDLLIVQSNGGVMAVETAKAQPVRTALSGPAAGVRAAQAIAEAAGFPDVITCDLGGTSYDVSLIAGGEAALAAQSQVDFGMTIRTPMIEITTIGAGGGSIARIDAGGLLQVGPESAGSNPGPACYGLGNAEPTLTDANLVLGRINAERPIGGISAFDVDAARAAIREKVGAPLNLSVEDAAEAILRVANAKMAGAIRLVSIERGHDPARFKAMPFGGGGALHVGAVIKDVGLKGALVPRYPGVTSALGCVVADMRHDRVRTVNRLLDEIDAAALGAELSATAAELEALLSQAGVPFDSVDTAVELDMLYVGQTHAVGVPLNLPEGGLTREAIAQAFDAAYRAAYGRLLENLPRRVMNTRVAVIGRRPKFDMTVFAPTDGRPAADCATETRRVYVDGGWAEIPVYDRLALGVGEVVVGPCLLEQSDTTIFIDPGLRGRTDRFGNLVLEPAS